MHAIQNHWLQSFWKRKIKFVCSSDLFVFHNGWPRSFNQALDDTHHCNCQKYAATRATMPILAIWMVRNLGMTTATARPEISDFSNWRGKTIVLHERHAFWYNYWRSLTNDHVEFSFLRLWPQCVPAAVNIESRHGSATSNSHYILHFILCIYMKTIRLFQHGITSNHVTSHKVLF